MATGAGGFELVSEIYRLRVGPYRPDQLLVSSFRGREAISKLYRFDVIVTSRVGLDEAFERTLLGHRAALTLRPAGVRRAFHGIVVGVEAQGLRGPVGDQVAQHRVRLVPRAWLLCKRKSSRIFQDMRVDEVIASVLREASVPARFRLEHTPPVRKYVTQYEETDWDFVTRLAAEAGLYFFFAQPASAPDEDDEGLLGTAAGIAAGAAGAAAAGLGSAIGGAVGGAVSQFAGGMAGELSGAMLPGEVLVFSDNASAYPALDDETAGTLEDALAGAAADNLARAGGALAGAAAEGLAGAAASIVPAAGALGGPAASAATGAVTEALGSALAPKAPAPTLAYREADALAAPSSDAIETFAAGRAIRASTSMYIEYDPERPMTPLRASARSKGFDIVGMAESAAAGALSDLASGLAPSGPLAGAASAAATGIAGAIPAVASALGLGSDDEGVAHGIEVYEHHGPYLFPDAAYADDEPKRILRQSRRRAQIARGTSYCARLSSGRRFSLDEFSLGRVNREYAVTQVEHHGVTRPGAGDGPRTPVYRNVFECVPADAPFVPRRPRRRVVQACLTATVVGPAGEEIHTDASGRIKVRFHWDRAARGENSSCWIRTMHAWGGVGWGTQFIPRVGMEVVVAFEAGDPDKPLVIGAVYNGTHPTAFPLPAQKTRSGIKTSSTPGGGGHNELSFDDTASREQIYVHAEKNLDVVVEDTRTATIHVDDVLTVKKDRREKVDGNHGTIVSGDYSVRVGGGSSVAVSGDASERTTGSRDVAVEGKTTAELIGDAMVTAQSDVFVQLRGSATTLVGRHDAKRSYTLRAEGTAQVSSSVLTEVASDKELLLRCGKSCIRIAEDTIELVAPSVVVRGDGARLLLGDDDAKLKVTGTSQIVADSILLKASGSSIGLTSEAKVDGSKVLLNSPTEASDEVETEEVEPTKIELSDQDGNPLPYERFRIVMDDGSEQTGITDKDGKAEVEIEGSGSVFFPDLSNAESA